MVMAYFPSTFRIPDSILSHLFDYDYCFAEYELEKPVLTLIFPCFHVRTQGLVPALFDSGFWIQS